MNRKANSRRPNKQPRKQREEKPPARAKSLGSTGVASEKKAKGRFASPTSASAIAANEDDIVLQAKVPKANTAATANLKKDKQLELLHMRSEDQAMISDLLSSIRGGRSNSDASVQPTKSSSTQVLVCA
jgi:hypothetical protein